MSAAKPSPFGERTVKVDCTGKAVVVVTISSELRQQKVAYEPTDLEFSYAHLLDSKVSTVRLSELLTRMTSKASNLSPDFDGAAKATHE